MTRFPLRWLLAPSLVLFLPALLLLLLLLPIGNTSNNVQAFSTTRNYKHPNSKERIPSSLQMWRVPHCSVPRRLESSLTKDIFISSYFPSQSSSDSIIGIWRSDASSVSTTASEDYNDFSSRETNTSKLILEAESLRAQAKAIMEQALAMEKELKESRSKVRKSKVRESDEIIQQWFHLLSEEGGKGETMNNNNKNGIIIIANATTVADRLEEHNVTPEQVLSVVERIFERRMEASGQTSFLQQTTQKEDEASSDTKGLLVATKHNETEFERLSDILGTLTRAVALLDERVNNSTVGGGGESAASSNTKPNNNNNNNNNKTNKKQRWSGRVEPAVQALLNELRRTQKVNLDRQLAAEISKTTSKSSSATGGGGSVEEHDMGATNNSSSPGEPIQENMALVPMWVPSAFLPFIIASTTSRFGPEQVKALNDQVLMGSKFFVTSHSSVPGAAIFRGNIRGSIAGGKAKGGNTSSKSTATTTTGSTQPTAEAFEDIQKRLEKFPDLQDRVQLFLLPDPEWRPKKDDQQEHEPKPVVLALSKDISPDESKIRKGKVSETAKKLVYPLALFTTIRYAIEGFSLNQIFFNALIKQRNMKVLLTMCFPVVGGILAMHLLQEVVHYLVAKWRRIEIGPPVPVPSLAFGMFGCITPIRSFPSSRAALLDFALSGPFATTIASIGCIIASLLLTVRASPASLASFPVLPAMIFKSSFLAGTLTSWIASKAMMLPLAQPIPVHPLFLVGYSGLMACGLNFLPIFRLDGGRACSAAVGPRQAAVISASMMLFLLSLALSGGTGIGFSWGMIVAIFQRRQEIPARDDVTEVDNVRLGAWMFSFLLAIGILTPFPGAPSIL